MVVRPNRFFMRPEEERRRGTEREKEKRDWANRIDPLPRGHDGLGLCVRKIRGGGREVERQRVLFRRASPKGYGIASLTADDDKGGIKEKGSHYRKRPALERGERFSL